MGVATKETTMNLLEGLVKAVSDLGIEGTIQLLIAARTKSLNLEDKRVEFVMRVVCAEFKIPVEEVINSYTKSTKRKFSIMFGIYYLHGTFGLSFGELKKLYKRDKGLLCRYYHEIKNLNRGNNDDKQLLKYRDKFDLLIAEYKLNRK